jgi:peptide/nickel transport system permease protein
VIPGDVSHEIAGKHASPETVAEVRREMGWDRPLFINLAAAREHGPLAALDSQFVRHFANACSFRFGRSIHTKERVLAMLSSGAAPSLYLTVPMFILSLVTSLTLALLAAFVRGSWLDHGTVLLCVLGLSLPYLAFILFGQYYFAYVLDWFPIQGYEPGLGAARYVALPVLIGVVSGLGGEVRFYRTVMLEEMRSDYVRTAYAKGVSTPKVLFVHVLKNAMIPVITHVVLAIPFLFLGSLLLERFFGVPGLGDITIKAITSRDYPVVNAVTFIIALLFVLGNLATDVCYALADPRVSLR